MSRWHISADEPPKDDQCRVKVTDPCAFIFVSAALRTIGHRLSGES